MNRARALGLAACALALSCAAPSLPGDDGGACAEGTARSALDAADRRVVGEASPWEPDASLRAQEDALAGSQRRRREVAWLSVEQVLADTALAEPVPAPGAALPRFQTWYDLADLRRVFDHAYLGLSGPERAARTPFDDAALDDAFEWNTQAVFTLPGWTEDHFDDYVAGLDTAARVAGVGAISRVSFSPGAARHLLASYPEILGCRERAAPLPWAEGHEVATALVRRGVELGPCAVTAVGDAGAAAHEVLRVEISGDDPGDLSVELTGSNNASCLARPGAPCELPGPVDVAMVARAGELGGRARVVASVVRAHPEWAACLDGPFTTDAAVVKADWRRVGLGFTLPRYDTSAEALAARQSGDVSWDVPDGEADPGPDSIYTLTRGDGASYRLAALHLMTKELDHWLWITLWWSDSPNSDFGADRPASLGAGPFSHYKMCVVTAFDERDPDPQGGFGGDMPSLGAALAAVHTGEGGPSWCSNPYLEEGHGNAGTNCIGCHQHAGTPLTSEDILAADPTFSGRRAARNNFPTDYSFAVDQGDDLSQLFADRELYYRDVP